jgi:hypothetical protein
MIDGRDIQKEIRALFFKEAVSAVIKKIVIQIPFLGYPVIGWMFASLVEWLAGKFWAEISLANLYLSIDIKEMSKLRDYQKSVRALKSALESKQPEDIKQKAKDEFRKKLREVIVLNPDDYKLR